MDSEQLSRSVQRHYTIRQICFVSGHDFSRAENSQKEIGLQPLHYCNLQLFLRQCRERFTRLGQQQARFGFLLLQAFDHLRWRLGEETFIA